MATSANLYAVNLDEIAQAIIAGGHQRTILVQGHMGTGKSSLLNMLSARATQACAVLLRLYHQGSGGYHDPRYHAGRRWQWVRAVPDQRGVGCTQ